MDRLCEWVHCHNELGPQDPFDQPRRNGLLIALSTNRWFAVVRPRGAAGSRPSGRSAPPRRHSNADVRSVVLAGPPSISARTIGCELAGADVHRAAGGSGPAAARRYTIPDRLAGASGAWRVGRPAAQSDILVCKLHLHMRIAERRNVILAGSRPICIRMPSRRTGKACCCRSRCGRSHRSSCYRR